MNLIALGLLCAMLGGGPAPKLDPNPANWARNSFIVDDKAVTVAVPKGHRFELQDPRRRGPIDLTKGRYQLMDAQYEYGCAEAVGLPEFTVVFTIVRYSAPQVRADIGMSEFAPLYIESLSASLPAGVKLQDRPSSVVVLAGRSWLAFSGQVGVTGYATPLSLSPMRWPSIYSFRAGKSTTRRGMRSDWTSWSVSRRTSPLPINERSGGHDGSRKQSSPRSGL